ncbi:MAG: PA0069 family radical SAM protein [Pseudohongiellaceae bacterium]
MTDKSTTAPRPVSKTRGAQYNPPNRFADTLRTDFSDGWELGELSVFTAESRESGADEFGVIQDPATETFVDHSKTIVSSNSSPDIPFTRSINPYKGCEHGCVYCFARPTHEYLDLSLGKDFESKIFYKPDAEALLQKFLAKPGYQCETIALGTNTDPYQPLEKEKQITRQILETLLRHRHPVSIVTKGSLILRDTDLLAEFARQGLVSVMVSVTTLDTQLKRIMEPRTASPSTRLKVISGLRDAGVPVGVMVAPVIPFVNDNELESIVDQSVAHGAQSLGYVMLRLPYQLKDLFSDWLEVHFPLRKERVLNTLRDMRGGSLYQAEFGKRMRGEGVYAELIRQRFEVVGRKNHQRLTGMPSPRTDLFQVPDRAEQFSLGF